MVFDLSDMVDDMVDVNDVLEDGIDFDYDIDLDEEFCDDDIDDVSWAQPIYTREPVVNVSDDFTVLAEEIADAHNILVITGAGASEESGVSTFRGDDGYWDQYEVERLSTPKGFKDDPQYVWRKYSEFREQLKTKKPNEGHKSIVELEQMFPDKNLTVVTQNVDSLHQSAGSSNVITIHGDIHQALCTNHKCFKSWMDYGNHSESLPTCHSCGSVMRPNVVWFGEMYNPEVYKKCLQAAYIADVILVVGTSGMVNVAGGLMVYAKYAYISEFNTELTMNSSLMDSVYLGKSGDTLPKMVDAVKLEIEARR